MDAIRLGISLRALRIRRGLRQIDVAASARVSRSLVSAIERGGLARVSLAAVGHVAAVLGADVDVRIRGAALSWIACSTKDTPALSTRSLVVSARPVGRSPSR